MNTFERSGKGGEPDRDLWICPANGCGSDLVQPMDWSEEGSGHWRLLLRCPECEWTEEGVFPNSQVTRLDEALDRHMNATLKSLREMTHDNMQETVEAFIGALARDAVLPEDF